LLNDLLIAHYLIVEISISLFLGLSIKYLAKISAQSSQNNRVSPFNEYFYKTFDKTTITSCFLFSNIDPEFVIIKYHNGIALSEEFYNFMGEKAIIKYQDLNDRGTLQWSILYSPFLLSLICLPLIFGCLLFLTSNNFPLLRNFSVELICSAIFWTITMPWIFLIPKLIKK
jgi:hypothetical protein